MWGQQLMGVRDLVATALLNSGVPQEAPGAQGSFLPQPLLTLRAPQLPDAAAGRRTVSILLFC